MSEHKNELDAEEEICSICLEALKDPVALPCRHSFCGQCLDSWRSKYDATSENTCPQCRSELPVTQEMMAQLKTLKDLRDLVADDLEKPGPIPIPPLPGRPGQGRVQSSGRSGLCLLTPGVIQMVHDEVDNPEKQQFILRAALGMILEQYGAAIASLEDKIHSQGVLEIRGEDIEILPFEINRGAAEGEFEKVVEWLGPEPVPAKRINAKCHEHVHRTLLHEAAYENRLGMMGILLQMGAYVNPKSAFGTTPFEQALQYPRLAEAAKFLLTWGAEIRPDEIATFREKNPEIIALIQMPLGGRRCEAVGLQGRADLNGRTGIVTKYLPGKDRYVFEVEGLPEKVLIRPVNLKRRDRTPRDCGIRWCYAGMHGEHHAYSYNRDFRSEEEADSFCQYATEKGYVNPPQP